MVNTLVGKHELFLIKDEYALTGEMAHGNVEYVCVGVGGLNTLVVLEIKTGDELQGFAQLFIEMFSMLTDLLLLLVLTHTLSCLQVKRSTRI